MESTDTDVLVQECIYDPPHTHEFPIDWQFGGPNGTDFRSDPRWNPTTYIYLSDKFEPLHRTQSPMCDDEAIDRFSQVATFGPDYNPRYLQAIRPDGIPTALPVEYFADTDEVFDKEWANG